MFYLLCSRWVRLLFGREFTFQDLIVLWDAIFADSSMLDLVDYIFVAMLIKIRELCKEAPSLFVDLLVHVIMSWNDQEVIFWSQPAIKQSCHLKVRNIEALR